VGRVSTAAVPSTSVPAAPQDALEASVRASLSVCLQSCRTETACRRHPAASDGGSAEAPALNAARIGQRTICQPGARATVILAARPTNSIDSRRRRGTLMGVLGPDLTHDGEMRHVAVGNLGGGGSDLDGGGVRAGLLVW
jgi:hypothetical protein